MKDFLIVSLLIFFISGCSTVVRLPSSTGQTPSVAGRLWGGRFGIDGASSIPVTIIDDISATPPRRTTLDVGRDGSLLSAFFPLDAIAGMGLDFALGVTERIDIYLTRNLGVRWMFWGDPKAPGWRSIVFVGGGTVGNSSSVTVGSSEYKSSTRMSYPEYGISIGNNFADTAMVYLTLASRGGSAETTVTHPNLTEYKFSDTFLHHIASLGFSYGASFYIKLEVSANAITWRGNPYNSLTELSGSSTRYGGTFGLGYIW